MRTRARGHGKTPEHPERAERAPIKYREYVNTRRDITARAFAKKKGMFGDVHKWNEERARKQIEKASLPVLRKFLGMDEDDVWGEVDWTESYWSFLYYH